MRYLFNVYSFIFELTLICRNLEGNFKSYEIPTSKKTPGKINIYHTSIIDALSIASFYLYLLLIINSISIFSDNPKKFNSSARFLAPPTFHPATSMDEGESRKFRVSNSRFVPKPGKETCGLNVKTYSIRKTREMKTDHKGDYFSFYFYAISGVNEFIEIQNGNETHKFESQIGYIRCSHGWISFLEVFRNRLGVANQETPRGCGIGVVLTELCFIDPDINNVNSGNRAMPKLQKDVQTQQLVKDNCIKLIGMTMFADPVAGALTYFSAAIRLDYRKLIVDPLRDGEKFKIYDTKVAKENFDLNTGRIEPCCHEIERCDTLMTNWFFCEGNQKSEDWNPFGL